MSITAKVEEGKIVLPADNPWPSGTWVRIEAVGKPAPPKQTLIDHLKKFQGVEIPAFQSHCPPRV
ncbi:MAG TPA: hypothetical protein PKA41_15350 [Verrucomicrobiota bacterium]|nr:hypothetical protein [Verrucomicrobiota bacterium]